MIEDARAEPATSPQVSTTVRPLTAAEAVLLLEDPDAFTRTTGLQLATGYLAFPEALPSIVQGLQAGGSPEWGSHLIIDPAASVVVGLGGFTGPPGDTGTVEVGYSVAPAHQGRGHARRAVEAWLDQAAASGVDAAIAHTLAEPNASNRVLEHCGFAMVATLPDDELGEVWQWRRDLQPDP
jgi:RimJ/RimL family protein N-acetyltransferase